MAQAVAVNPNAADNPVANLLGGRPLDLSCAVRYGVEREAFQHQPVSAHRRCEDDLQSTSRVGNHSLLGLVKLMDGREIGSMTFPRDFVDSP